MLQVGCRVCVLSGRYEGYTGVIGYYNGFAEDGECYRVDFDFGGEAWFHDGVLLPLI